MARIRSIHPGIFTDEAFMLLSSDARTLLFGIWCHAWDDGVFEWKPVQLKVKVFPYNDVHILPLLGELEEQNLIKRFDAGGKDFAAIKNFQKYQRPKKPSSSGVLPQEFRTFVGCKAENTEEVPNQSGTSDEPSPQKGGREERRKGEESNPQTPSGGKADKPPKQSRTKFVQVDQPEGFPDQLWQDFIATRRQNNAPITQTAMAGLEREASNANVSLQQAISLICERGWRGFKAEWVKPGDIPKPQLVHSQPEQIMVSAQDEPEFFDFAVDFHLQRNPNFDPRGREHIKVPSGLRDTFNQLKARAS